MSASPSNGQYWNITIASDGAATITNSSVNKYVQYSVSHTSFGSYATAQSGALMPVLYEYIGESESQGGDEPGGEPVDGKVFQKVSASQSDWSGEYLIVYDDGKLALDGSQDDLKGTQSAPCVISVSISGNTIAATTATVASTFKITKNGSAYTITSKSGLPIGNTSDSNNLLCAKSGTYTNAISYDSSEGCVDIKAVEGNSHLRFNSSASGGFFRYYKNASYKNQKPIQLYKLVSQ